MNAAWPPVPLNITPVHHNPLLPRLTKTRMAVFVFIIIIIIPPTQDLTLLVSATSEKEKKWLFNFKNFSLVSLVFSFMLRNLTGQLEDWHFRRSSLKTRVLCLGRRTVWKVPPSPSSREPRFLEAASLERGDRIFYSFSKTSYIIVRLILKVTHKFKKQVCAYILVEKSVYIHVCETLLFMFFSNEKEYVSYSKGKK